MEGFIEVTDFERRDKMLIRTTSIMSISTVKGHGTFIETYNDEKGTGGYCVRETYEEIKNKIKNCEVN